MTEMEMARFLFWETEGKREYKVEKIWENFDLELFLRKPGNMLEMHVWSSEEKFKLEEYILILWLLSITMQYLTTEFRI